MFSLIEFAIQASEFAIQAITFSIKTHNAAWYPASSWGPFSSPRHLFQKAWLPFFKKPGQAE